MKVQVDFSFLRQLKNEIVLQHGERLHLFEVDGLIVDQAFSVVHLRTGHIGLSMNYGVVFSGREKMRKAGVQLKAELSKDPLLLNSLWDMNIEMDPFLRCSLQTSLLSALSKPLLVTPTVSKFKKVDGGISLREVVREGDSVAVIGLGGYLQAALENPLVKTVYLADYFVTQPERKNMIESLKRTNSEKEFIVTDGSENASILAQSQIACITASSLSNGSLDSLLDSCKACRTVILQGHSGHVWPEFLFKRGVHFITTSVIPANAWKDLQLFLHREPMADLAEFLDQNFKQKIGYGKALTN